MGRLAMPDEIKTGEQKKAGKLIIAHKRWCELDADVVVTVVSRKSRAADLSR
jgi:hypothetical protein